jgi:hypothetical protein
MGVLHDVYSTLGFPVEAILGSLVGDRVPWLGVYIVFIA